jgi:hypothetical protein
MCHTQPRILIGETNTELTGQWAFLTIDCPPRALHQCDGYVLVRTTGSFPSGGVGRPRPRRLPPAEFSLLPGRKASLCLHVDKDNRPTLRDAAQQTHGTVAMMAVLAADRDGSAELSKQDYDLQVPPSGAGRVEDDAPNFCQNHPRNPFQRRRDAEVSWVFGSRSLTVRAAVVHAEPFAAVTLTLRPAPARSTSLRSSNRVFAERSGRARLSVSTAQLRGMKRMVAVLSYRAEHNLAVTKRVTIQVREAASGGLRKRAR